MLMKSQGLTRITFPGYTHDQLMTIIQSRLEGVPGNIVDPDAVQFASRKVAAVSGDARRALDICRRAVEIAEAESAATQDPLLATPSKKARLKEAGAQKSSAGRVMISTIKRAINEATSSPLQQFLKTSPLASKLLLAALLARVRRTGIAESVLGDVIEEAKRLGQMANNSAVQEYLLIDGAPFDKAAASGQMQRRMAARALAMGAAAVELMEAGVIGIEPRKGERTGKIRLNIGEEEVNLALKDDQEVRGLGFSS